MAAASASPADVTAPAPASGALAFTGTHTLRTSEVGLLVIAFGLILILLARSRRQSTKKTPS